MAKILMPEIAHLLGVELDEVFLRGLIQNNGKTVPLC